MTFVYNSAEKFVEEALSGLVKAHPGRLRSVPGGIARADGTRPGKVAVVVGGGSGHYPAFAGVIGDGMADAAVCGQIFTSPSTRQAVDVLRAADAGAGVWVSFGFYAGDVLNFGAAASRLRAQGMDVRIQYVTDDIASAPIERAHERRGIAGDHHVFKIAGAAAEANYNLDEVTRVAAHANDWTRSFGLAFAGCTLPGQNHPLFTVEPGTAGWGLGIHGEPGIDDGDLPSADDMAKRLVDTILAEWPTDTDGVKAPSRAAVMLNGLGTVKYEELFVLWNTVHDLLVDRGITLVAPLVGEFVTSLDMAGVSLTVTWLDDELEQLWLAPVDSPAFTHGSWKPALPADQQPAPLEATPPPPIVPATTDAGRAAAVAVLDTLKAAQVSLHDAEEELGALDAIAGDGDHGRGMSRGIDAAVEAGAEALNLGGNAQSVLRRAGDAWADKAGGTSGILWGVGLLAFADQLPEDAPITATHIVAGVDAFRDKIMTLGGAVVGDKTLVDSLAPATAALTSTFEATGDIAAAWLAAVTAAREGAKSTINITSRRGRSRALGDKSLGTPDPGATSLAMLFAHVGVAAGLDIPGADQPLGGAR